MNVQTLDISGLRLDGGTQPRAEISLELVSEYADAMKRGDVFEPIIVYVDGADSWVADGFHRIHGARMAGLGAIVADVRTGTRRDAVLYSVGANQGHGLRRTNADKWKAVTTLLHDGEWRTWTSEVIARHCGVSNHFVGDVRRSFEPNSDPIRVSKRTYTTKHGTVATMNTTNIGKRQGDADKRQRVALALETGEFAAASNSSVAEALGVGVHLVADVRKSNPEGHETNAAGRRIVLQPGHESHETRVDQIRTLAGQGYTSEQMADRLGITPERVRELARQGEINLADRLTGRRPRVDVEQLARQTIMHINATASAVETLNIQVEALSPVVAAELADDLSRGLAILQALKHNLRKRGKSYGNSMGEQNGMGAGGEDDV